MQPRTWKLEKGIAVKSGRVYLGETFFEVCKLSGKRSGVVVVVVVVVVAVVVVVVQIIIVAVIRKTIVFKIGSKREKE